MQSGWRIGYLFGIPLYIDSSWFIILALLTLANGADWQNQHPEWGSVVAWSAGLVLALLLFASVLLHELGHSLVARSQGIKVNSITLFLFGGVASIEQESKTPGKAFQVAIAGPAVSLILCFLFSAFAQFPGPQPVKIIAAHLAQINLILTLFNLIPGLPLDGGQIVKAAVWKLTGDRFAGVHWAAKAGKALGWTAITLGVAAVLLGGREGIGGLWIALLGWFGVRNASAYDRLTDLQEALVRLTAADAMNREFRVVDAEMTLREFADQYLLIEGGASEKPFYAASNGRYRGMILTDDIRFVERSLWEKQTLHHIARPFADLITVDEKTPIVEAINRLEVHQLRRMTVLSPAGAVAGVIDRGDIVQAVCQKLNLPIPEAEIKRIKQEGDYPQGLQLGTIAKATADVVSNQKS